MSPKPRIPNVAGLARRTGNRPGVPASALLRAIEADIAAQRWPVALAKAKAVLQHTPEGSAPSLRAAYLAAIAAYQYRIYDEAVLLARYVVECVPESSDARYNLGCYLEAAGDTEAAIAEFRYCLLLNPAHTQAEVNLGALFKQLGRADDGDLCLERALARPVTTPESAYNRSSIALARGDFRQGWAWYEARWQCQAYRAEYARVDLRTPRWTPARARDHVLVWAEQGFGDTLQFLRFLPWVAARAQAVTCQVQPELVSLLSPLLASWGIATVPLGTPAPAHDSNIPLLSIPPLCMTAEADIPPVPPLAVTPAVLPGTRRIGLCWAGSARHHNDRNRSAPLAAFGALFATPGVTWVSLVKGDRGVEFHQHVARQAEAALDPMGGARTWADTAAIVAACETVVTVDTGLAHLAGTLGVPTITMLPVGGEWRWMEDRTDTPWYPSMTLVRHPGRRDWAHVAQTVTAHLLPSLAWPEAA